MPRKRDEIRIDGEPCKPIRVGTTTVVDAETGEVIEERRNAGMLMPCAPDVCQECAVDHPHDQPHNRDSMYYQMQFHATHDRWPTWTDAMAHCAEPVRSVWRASLISQMEAEDMPVPDDLMDPKPAGR